MENPVIRIVVADDHEMLLEGIQTLIKKQPAIDLVGMAKNGEELVQLVDDTKPDVIITDIKMPKLNGIEATKAILKKHPGMKVIAFTVMDNDYAILDMLEAGAIGYITKNTDKYELLNAIHSAHSGKPYYCPTSSFALIKLIGESKFNLNALKHNSRLFDKKEREIINLICEGYSSHEIADKLHLSIRTIEWHRLHISKKMDVTNTAGIAIYAVKAGLYQV